MIVQIMVHLRRQKMLHGGSKVRTGGITEGNEQNRIYSNIKTCPYIFRISVKVKNHHVGY
jgi:hypothetical protein